MRGEGKDMAKGKRKMFYGGKTTKIMAWRGAHIFSISSSLPPCFLHQHKKCLDFSPLQHLSPTFYFSTHSFSAFPLFAHLLLRLLHAFSLKLFTTHTHFCTPILRRHYALPSRRGLCLPRLCVCRNSARAALALRAASSRNSRGALARRGAACVSRGIRAVVMRITAPLVVGAQPLLCYHFALILYA